MGEILGKNECRVFLGKVCGWFQRLIHTHINMIANVGVLMRLEQGNRKVMQNEVEFTTLTIYAPQLIELAALWWQVQSITMLHAAALGQPRRSQNGPPTSQTYAPSDPTVILYMERSRCSRFRSSFFLFSLNIRAGLRMNTSAVKNMERIVGVEGRRDIC
ncbi:hypothetical protein IEQ34_008572 [Dendrobium chrysotoxum]|uniref:Uncharacterized protein n=1 Tax=Dendrobium chrysotoxum TaxID=161865 RepID=A0AAV7GZQ9_DENCH|nr:hypothetical protein IEQ34_008572 [Dendrobium chrysotoxum]